MHRRIYLFRPYIFSQRAENTTSYNRDGREFCRDGGAGSSSSEGSLGQMPEGSQDNRKVLLLALSPLCCVFLRAERGKGRGGYVTSLQQQHMNRLAVRVEYENRKYLDHLWHKIKGSSIYTFAFRSLALCGFVCLSGVECLCVAVTRRVCVGSSSAENMARVSSGEVASDVKNSTDHMRELFLASSVVLGECNRMLSRSLDVSLLIVFSVAPRCIGGHLPLDVLVGCSVCRAW